MKDQFIPYELALKLKELGFVFYPFGYYSLLEDNKIIESTFYASDDFLEAPLWQQAFDWLFKEFSYICTITNNMTYKQKENILNEAIRDIQNNISK